MPQLEPDKYAEIALKIDELEPLAADDELPGKGNEFILDQVERKRQYGERMFLSPKQVEWIESLHNEHIGAAAPKVKGLDDKPVDLDDDIPF